MPPVVVTDDIDLAARLVAAGVDVVLVDRPGAGPGGVVGALGAAGAGPGRLLRFIADVPARTARDAVTMAVEMLGARRATSTMPADPVAGTET